jgi:hypothetical protein
VKFHKLLIHIHPSIPSDSKILQGKFDETKTIFDGLVSLLSDDQTASKSLLVENDIRFGYLFITNKIELRTTRKLNELITMDLEIRVIPISHGG